MNALSVVFDGNKKKKHLYNVEGLPITGKDVHLNM